MAEAEIGTEEQEETEGGRGGGEELAALLVGGDGGARLGLVDAGDGVTERGRSSGDAFQPAHKAAQALGVSGARVLGEALPPVLGDALDARGRELRGEHSSVVFD